MGLENDVIQELRDLRARVIRAERDLAKKDAQINQLKQIVKTVYQWNGRISRVETGITELEHWKRGAIAQINALINFAYGQLDDITKRWQDSRETTDSLFKQMGYIKRLAKPRKPWQEEESYGLPIDVEADELPPSGSGHPNNLP